MKKRYENIDIIKGVAIILVIIGHQVHLFEPMQWSVSTWVNGFHLPLFMFAGGFIAYKTAKPSIQNLKGWLLFVISKLRTLILPYTIWSIIVYPIINGKTDLDILGGLYTYFITPPDTVLWFLYTYFILSILFGIYYILEEKIQILKSFLPNILLIGVIYFVCIALSKFFSFVPYNLIAFFPYYFLGVLFSKYQFIEKYSKNNFVLTFVFVMFFVCSLHYQGDLFVNENLKRILKLTIGCSASILFYHLTNLFQLYKPVKEMFILFGKQSLAIYILHFLLLFDSGFNMPETPNYWMFVFGVIMAVVIGYTCIWISILISKIPILDTILFGRIRKKVR